MLQSFQRPTTRKLPVKKDRFQDEARFLRSWLERPLTIGAVTPSGKVLARTMASYVDPRIPGPIVELGPGTGPVTDALIRRGVEQERLILVEFNPEFCQLLKRRFPKATIVQGDAYDLKETLSGILKEPAAATVSSLPLFTKPMDHRLDLLETAQELMHPNAPFVQFTYAVVPPIPARSKDYRAKASNRIWRNLPPARVWVYNKAKNP
ncbi:class I SAM-dependent methyltransferase [Microvirga guangxiensis]|uniref:Phosphatidylethanolamine/phosphatidyl-N-methylethanolamine N-methyltransferase n=1 Tax=Microvirga guangxiensis TaxID=549386 RepID=A0A1G5FAJ4_9HYPH|nr:phospholipid methyltransferase [Microvirga guangxiensis]SCY36164.1 phosphatidylethanolamine/phosphatidyl-N-methylethanolamine N-methyltransferase [Microvirga guangxiensis]